MVVIFGAGGTAGHIFMALGIAYHIQEKCILITDKRGSQYVENDSPFDEVHVLPISSAKECLSIKLPQVLFACKKIFDQNPGATYFGCGAYISLLAGAVALLKGSEIHIYQGDQVVGRANQLLHHFAKVNWVSSNNLHLKNAEVVGCVARHNMTSKPMRNDGTFNLLVLGSSIGSSLVELALPTALSMLEPELRSKIRLVQQNRNPERLERMYDEIGIEAKVGEFINSQTEIAKAHLIIGRAGWSLISDIVSVGRAAILIPWSAAKDNHQYHNALWLSPDRKWVLEEHEVTPYVLVEIISSLAQDMLTRNVDCETIEQGIIADRVREVREKFAGDGGSLIAGYFNARQSNG